MKPGGRHIGGRIFTMLTLLSLLLGIAVAGLWVRGVWWASDMWSGAIGGMRSQLPEYGLDSGAGRMWAWCFPKAKWGNGEWLIHGERPTLTPTIWWPPLAGTDLELPHVMVTSAEWRQGTVADWLLLIVFSVLPVFWWFVRGGDRICRKRLRLGLCMKCGYDLRASTGTCPECGTSAINDAVPEHLLLHRLWRDGFVFLRLRGGWGQLTTRALVLRRPELTLNLLGLTGHVRVQVCDAAQKPLRGYTFDDCPLLTGDEVAAPVRWKSKRNVSALRGRPIRLQIRLIDARLYAIHLGCGLWYANTPEPIDGVA